MFIFVLEILSFDRLTFALFTELNLAFVFIDVVIKWIINLTQCSKILWILFIACVFTAYWKR